MSSSAIFLERKEIVRVLFGLIIHFCNVAVIKWYMKSHELSQIYKITSLLNYFINCCYIWNQKRSAYISGSTNDLPLLKGIEILSLRKWNIPMSTTKTRAIHDFRGNFVVQHVSLWRSHDVFHGRNYPL